MLRKSPFILMFGAALAIGFAPDAPVALAQAAIQSQDLNEPGFSADLVEARRSDGVLSIKVRLKNTGARPARINIFENRNVDAYYVQAENKKYFVLRDTEKVPLSVAWNGFGSLAPEVNPGATFTWWAKYPAPPANVKKISFYWPLGAPFDDVPITDK
jgi:hypothetical protein